jgi:hypothetical protein
MSRTNGRLTVNQKLDHGGHFYVRLPASMKPALEKIAQSEYRHPAQVARLFLLHALQERGETVAG